MDVEEEQPRGERREEWSRGGAGASHRRSLVRFGDELRAGGGRMKGEACEERLLEKSTRSSRSNKKGEKRRHRSRLTSLRDPPERCRE